MENYTFALQTRQYLVSRVELVFKYILLSAGSEKIRIIADIISKLHSIERIRVTGTRVDKSEINGS